MADISKRVMDQAARDPKPGSFLESVGGAPFLTAQLFTILATVLGVYLAGYVGFQRTLEYDRFTKAQQQTDLLTAMSEELRQNVARLHKLDERLPADSGYGVGANEWPRLRTFIWQSAGRSSSFFDAPPQTLTDMQALYEDIGEMLADNSARQAFAHLSSSNTADRVQYKERLNAKLKYAETAILPAVEKAVAAAKQIADKYSK